MPLDATSAPWSAWASSPDALLSVAALLVAGALVGEVIAQTTRLPRVVGYSAAGFLAAAFGFGVPVPLAGTLRIVADLALGLLLFEIGARVHLRWLRRNPGLLATSLAESLLGGAAVALALLLLGVAPATAAACAVLSVPASAAVAGRVALELGAEGQVTQRMALLTALNTLYAVLALVVLRLAWATGQAPDMLAALAALAWSFFGSLLLALLLGGAVSLLARRLDLRNESAVLLLFGLVVLAVVTARWLSLSAMLVPLLAGLVLANTSPRPWVWPRHFGTAGGVLVLVLFVVVASAWSVPVLLAGGLAAIALVLARGLAKGAAVLLLAPWAKSSLRQGLALAITLTPLSATALLMLSDLLQTAPDIARDAAPIVLTAIAMLELVGPIAVQLALRLAGELDRPAARH